MTSRCNLVLFNVQNNTLQAISGTVMMMIMMISDMRQKLIGGVILPYWEPFRRNFVLFNVSNSTLQAISDTVIMMTVSLLGDLVLFSVSNSLIKAMSDMVMMIMMI